MAPFLFIGEKYNEELKQMYTTTETKDIARKKGILSFFMGNSLASSKPLQKMIERHFGMKQMEEVAIEHEKGRRLYIGTTNLDAERIIAWDMGAIASKRSEEALLLFRQVMLASSSIPALLPPVYIDVEAGGERYNEMHVDGGTSTQVFFLFPLARNFDVAAMKAGIDRSKLGLDLYVLRNGFVRSEWASVNNKALDIANRSLGSLIRSQAMGDFYRIYAFTESRGATFQLGYIPSDFVSQSDEPFDPVEMRRLYERGFADAKGGYAWRDVPPGLESDFQGKKEELALPVR